ncbi:NAD(P)-dependent alcohol dehydrogenase, partial [Methylophaga sp. UBA1918]
MKTVGYAAHSSDTPLAPYHFERRELRDNDVAMEILYCGVCHSDLHVARNDWGGSSYPVVPGHEIVGRVTAVGSNVSKYNVGDHVAVGCMVDSCQECDECHNDHEQYCRNTFTLTYGSPDRITNDMTQGGYSKHIVVREEFVLRLPENLDLAKAAPLLCAGITTYSPLREWNVGPGSRVGVVGMGGLGHMAIKLAVGLGADVTVISTSPKKEADAQELGAHNFLVSKDEDAMAAAASSFDLIIDTVPVNHDLNPYIPLLDNDATLVMVGQIGPIEGPNTAPMVFGRRRIAGSLIGGIKETQEMLDFCGRM